MKKAHIPNEWARSFSRIARSRARTVLTRSQIRSIQPDWVVTIELNKELRQLIGLFRDLRFLRLSPSPLAKQKSRSARIQAREKAFVRYFKKSQLRRLTLQILRGSNHHDDQPLGRQALRNRLCGILSAREHSIGLGIVIRTNPKTGELILRTPIQKNRIHALELGDLWITSSGKELRRI